jgi:hypothetical protein
MISEQGNKEEIEAFGPKKLLKTNIELINI